MGLYPKPRLPVYILSKIFRRERKSLIGYKINTDTFQTLYNYVDFRTEYFSW